MNQKIETIKNMYCDLLRDSLLDSIYGKQKQIDGDGHVTDYACDEQVLTGTYWPERAHTMIGKIRMDNVRYCVEQCLCNNVPGDLIETGVWRGGATIFMKGILKANDDTTRKVFVADSFEGLPKPEPNKYPADINDMHSTFPFLSVSDEEVRNNFKAYNLLDDNVIFIKGFFENSLKKAPIKKLAILRLDGDMYSSTIQVLETLYDKVSKGGFVIVDDYSLVGARTAVDDFRGKRKIINQLIKIDDYSVYWIK